MVEAIICGKLARRLAVPKFPGPQKVSDRQALHDPIISVSIRNGEFVPASQGSRSLQHVPLAVAC